MNTGELVAFVETLHRIWCADCKKEALLPAHTFSKIEAADAFYNNGWRLIDKVVHCPRCQSTQQSIVPEAEEE